MLIISANGMKDLECEHILKVPLLISIGAIWQRLSSPDIIPAKGTTILFQNLWKKIEGSKTTLTASFHDTSKTCKE